MAYEVLLMRLFSNVHWHHFAYMIISVALLGFGASGTFIAIKQVPLLRAYRTAYLASGAAFAISTWLCFLLAERFAFNTLEILWDPRQWLWLSLTYTVLALPFFFLANLFALSLQRFDGVIGRIYGADLLGAGFGAGSILVLLYVVPPSSALVAVTTLALIAWLVALIEIRPRHPTLWGATGLIAIAASWLAPGNVPPLVITPYKGLPQTLLIPGTRIIDEQSNPLAVISVVASADVPFRHAPGMSLSASAEIPPQLGVFSDGDGFSAITQYSGDTAELAYLDALTSALPYHLVTQPRTLVVGASGDAILQAVGGGAVQVDAVEINPLRNALLESRHADFYGWSHLAGRVQLHDADVRAWLTSAPTPYDLIVFPLDESSTAAGAGVHGLMEDFLLTEEALSLYWSRLTQRGALAITRWVKLPPRDELKVVNTALDVLAADGIADAAEHIALIRGWKTTTLLLTRSPIEPAGAAVIRGFAKTRSFDVVHYPGMSQTESNRFNRLAVPYYETGMRGLLGEDRAGFVQGYPFNIAPATDDRPYFFQFFRWSSLPTVLRLREVGGLSFFEWGYPVLVATLFQAILASAVLIVAPLLLRSDGRRSITQAGRWVAPYFALVGFAFMCVEMAFIQKLTLFLHHPVHAAATALSSILVFAGLGSRYAQTLGKLFGASPIIRGSTAWLAALLVIYLVVLPKLFEACLGWPLAAKLMVSLTVLAPAALLMGMPFPAGLARLARTHPAAVPWAWCINGCASVISAVAGTLAAVHWGFSTVLLIATTSYAVVALMDYSSNSSNCPNGLPSAAS